MNLCIYRGTCEIGGTCIELEHGDVGLLLDIGMPLMDGTGARFDFENYRGLDGRSLVREGVLPNILGAYAWNSDSDGVPIKGLLISHAHLDHYGLAHYLDGSIPVYLGEATQRLMECTAMMSGASLTLGNPTHFEHGVPFRCGPFRVTPFLMDHSAFDAYALLVEAGGKRVLYSGDFRDHGRKSGRLRDLFRNVASGVDALLLEGTLVGAERGAMLTEDALEKKAHELCVDTGKAVLCYFSSQNIDRLVSFYRAARRAGRQFVIDAYMAKVLDLLSKTKGRPRIPTGHFEDVRVFFPVNVSKRLKAAGSFEEIAKSYGKKVIRREELSARGGSIVMAVRPSHVDYIRKVDGLEGATFVYSNWRGYEKEAYTRRIMDFADEKKMRIEYLHTSGHASVDALETVVRTLDPQRVIPIHTLHPEGYEALGGRVVRLTPGVWLDL